MFGSGIKYSIFHFLHDSVEISKNERNVFMKNFVDFPLIPEVQASLETLGFTTPTQIQEKVIPLLLEAKHDIHAQAQTGTGKTLAFGIPLLHIVKAEEKKVQALVVAPTRELVLQTYEALRDVARGTGIHIEPVYGGMPINQQITAIKRGAQIIIGTPGRLNDHLRRKTLSLKDLKVLVLDEADIMLDMGFKEEIDGILKAAPKERLIWLFSATVGMGIKRLINSHMNNVVVIKSTQKNEANAQVTQYFCVTPNKNRLIVLARFIESAPAFYGIVFCQTKILTNEVMEQLVSRGFKANCLHGDMSQSLRNQIIKGFKHKDFMILVATDVAARGIDVSDLTHVVNYSLPEEHENYIHRIGRTARAGKEGVAITLVAPSQRGRVKRLEMAVKTKLQEIPVPSIETVINAKMSAVSDFIEQSKKEPEKKMSAVHNALNVVLEAFSPEEMKKALLNALEDKFFKDIVNEKLVSKVSHEGSYNPQEICINIGRDDGLDEETVRDYLYVTCQLAPQDVSKVRVINTKTFICVSTNKTQECLNILRSKKLGNQTYKAFLVEDTFDREPRGPRRSSDRCDRPRDFGRSGKRDMRRRR